MNAAMKSLYIISLIFILGYNITVSQTCKYIWDPVPRGQQGFRGTSGAFMNMVQDSSSIYFYAEALSDTVSSYGLRYLFKINKQSCLEEELELNDFGFRKIPMDNIFLGKDHLFHIEVDDGALSYGAPSPQSGDPRLDLFNPGYLVKYALDDLKNVSQKQILSEEGSYFCFGLKSYTYIADKEYFFAFGTVIDTQYIDTLLNNPAYGFQFIKPCWVIFDENATVLDFNTIGPGELNFSGNQLHYDKNLNRVFALGGQIQEDRFPKAWWRNGCIAEFDLDTKTFLKVQDLFPSTDTVLWAEPAFWSNNGFLFDGSMALGTVVDERNDLYYLSEYKLAAGKIRFDGESTVNVYSEDTQFNWNRIFYADSDSSFLMTRKLPKASRSTSIDKEHIWIWRMHKDGYLLDTFAIKHGIDLDEEHLRSALYDTLTNDLFLLGEYSLESSGIQIQELLYPFLIKMPFQEILDLINSISENNTDIYEESSGVLVYPTLFYDNLNFYNKSDQSKEVEIQLFDVSGRLVLKENHYMVHHEFVTISDLAGLSSGTYFYNLKINGKSFSGQVVKQ